MLRAEKPLEDTNSFLTNFLSFHFFMNTFIRQNDRDRQEENAREHTETIK